MAFLIHREATTDGIRIRLVEHDISSFAIIYDGDGIAAIAHRTSDFACAQTLFKRSIDIASLGFSHPAWKPSAKQIPINIGG